MNALFAGGREFLVRTRDFRNFVLASAKEIQTDTERYRIPYGAQSDLASTPQIMWSAGLPPFGSYAPDAYAHDSAYRGTLELKRGDLWVPANLDQNQCDDLFNALMFSGGVDEGKRKTLYEGVHLLGWKAFRDDRAQATNPAQAPTPSPL